MGKELVALSQQEFRKWTSAVLTPLIVKSGAVLEGEFTLSSGISSPIKIEGDYILQDPEVFFQICRFMEAWVLRHGKIPDIFVGVVRGGVPYAQYLARKFDRYWAA